MQPAFDEQDQSALMEAVRAFWNAEACGQRYADGETLKEQLAAQARRKYELEPYIHDFAKFHQGRGKRVLEIGVGMGADHAQWALSGPAHLAGVDLTEEAVRLTGARLDLAGLRSDLRVANAEKLPFESESFDLVYSWGVLHHTANPGQAVHEVHRVLRPGGRARVMLYHKHGYAFALLWLRYALLVGRPQKTLDDVIWHHNESVGTRAYTPESARQLFAAFASVQCRTILTHADLLDGDIGARHRGVALTLLKKLWPRWLVRRAPHRWGSDLLIEAVK